MAQPGFWDFAVDLYGRPGVESACLALQDGVGLDVGVMLFCLWLAKNGGSIGPILDSTMALSEEWQGVVTPLRASRRALKAMPANDSIAGLRAAVKTAELDAEHAEIAALENLAGAAGTCAAGRPGAEDNLRRYFSALNIAADLLGRDEVLRIVNTAFPG